MSFLYAWAHGRRRTGDAIRKVVRSRVFPRRKTVPDWSVCRRSGRSVADRETPRRSFAIRADVSLRDVRGNLLLRVCALGITSGGARLQNVWKRASARVISLDR